MPNCKDLLKNAAPIMICLLVTMGFFFFVYRLTLPIELPKENAAQLNILLGGIAVVWAKSVGFFYDNSASGKAKDEALQEIAKGTTGTGNGTPPPITIPGADKVVVSTETGDVNIPTQPTGG